jgi:hypothetical protein
MALLPLLRPFEWQGPFIPLVPKNLEECVESPGTLLCWIHLGLDLVVRVY